jgi:hypothetical protein
MVVFASTFKTIFGIFGMLLFYGTILWLIAMVVRKGGFAGTRELPSELLRGRRLYRFKSRASTGDIRYKNAVVTFELYEHGLVINAFLRRKTWLHKRDIVEVLEKECSWAEAAIEFVPREGEVFQIVGFHLELDNVWRWWGTPEKIKLKLPPGARRIF